MNTERQSNVFTFPERCSFVRLGEKPIRGWCLARGWNRTSHRMGTAIDRREYRQRARRSTGWRSKESRTKAIAKRAARKTVYESWLNRAMGKPARMASVRSVCLSSNVALQSATRYTRRPCRFFPLFFLSSSVFLSISVPSLLPAQTLVHLNVSHSRARFTGCRRDQETESAREMPEGRRQR